MLTIRPSYNPATRGRTRFSEHPLDAPSSGGRSGSPSSLVSLEAWDRSDFRDYLRALPWSSDAEWAVVVQPLG